MTPLTRAVTCLAWNATAQHTNQAAAPVTETASASRSLGSWAGVSTVSGRPPGLQDATRNPSTKRNTRTSPEDAIEKEAQKPIIDIKEDAAPKTDVQKNTFRRHRKNRCPLQSLPAKSHLQPLHQSRQQPKPPLTPKQETNSTSQKTEKTKPKSSPNSFKRRPRALRLCCRTVSGGMGHKAGNTKNLACRKRSPKQPHPRAESCHQRQLPVANRTKTDADPRSDAGIPESNAKPSTLLPKK